jgi:hypothetical protein
MSNKGVKLAKSQKLPRKAGKNKTQKSLFGRVLAIALGTATLIGGALALLAVLPRLTVIVSDPVYTDKPFSSLTTIANTGFIPLNAVTVCIGLHKIISTTSPNRSLAGFPGPEYRSRICNMSIPHPDLGLDDKFTFALNEVFETSKANLQGTDIAADIAVVVDYEIPLIHWHHEKIVPYTLKKQTNGNFYWYGGSRAN